MTQWEAVSGIPLGRWMHTHRCACGTDVWVRYTDDPITATWRHDGECASDMLVIRGEELGAQYDPTTGILSQSIEPVVLMRVGAWLERMHPNGVHTGTEGE